jgi:predicted XRE-type DNA-binding protein
VRRGRSKISELTQGAACTPGGRRVRGRGLRKPRSVRASALAKLREDVDAGWKDIDAGRVSDFGAMTIKRRGRKKLASTGSGHVFADLGLTDAPELKRKVRLAVEINRLIKDHRLTQVSAAECLEVSQSEISALKSYQLDGFSVERLTSFLLTLRRDVERHSERFCKDRKRVSKAVTTLSDKLAALPSARQEKIKKRAAALIAEEMARRNLVGAAAVRRLRRKRRNS